MQKLILVSCLFFFSFYIHAQSFQGIIKNAETQEPISQITIVSEDQSFFTTSNEKGEVVLPSGIINKKLIIEAFEYQSSDKIFTNEQSFIWELKPNSETLEEIVIYNRPLKDVLLEIIENSVNSFSKNKKVEAFYKENYFIDNKNASFAEGILDFYIGKKLKNVQVVAKQSRIEEIIKVNKEDDIYRAAAPMPSSLIEAAMRFKALTDIIKSKDYEFYVTSKKVGNNTLHVCYFSPTEKSDDRFLVKGHFIFDNAKKLILENYYTFDPQKRQFNKPINILVAKIDIEDIIVESKYVNTSSGFYYPTYAKIEFKASATSKKKELNAKWHSNGYFYTLHFSDTENIPAKEDLLKGYLYSNGNKYTEEFWKEPKIKNLTN